MRSILLIFLFIFSSSLFGKSETSSCNINGGPPFIFTAQHSIGSPCETVNVGITASGFQNVISFQFGVRYDPRVLKFDYALSSVFDTDDFFAGFPVTGEANLTTAMGSLLGIPYSVSDDTEIFSLYFTLLHNYDDCSPIEFGLQPGGAQGAEISVETTSFNYTIGDIVFNNGEVCCEKNELNHEVTSFNTNPDESILGSISLNISGGLPPYNISILDTKTKNTIYSSTTSQESHLLDNLNPSKYEIEIFDSQADPECLIDFLTIHKGNPIEISGFNITPVSCPDSEDGQLEVIFEIGDFAVDNITWEKGLQRFYGNPIDMLESGEYNAVITSADGNKYSKMVKLNTAEDLSIISKNTSIIHPTCGGLPDGSIQIQAIGGTAPYTFLLNNGMEVSSGSGAIFSNLDAGDWMISIMDSSNCQSIDLSYTLVNEPIYSEIQSTICDGEKFEGYSSNGTYEDSFITVEDCDSIRTLILEVLPLSEFILIDTICEGEMLEGYTMSGIYEDIFEASNGCDSIRIIDLLVLPLDDSDCMENAVTNIEDQSIFSIQPNPAYDYINFDIHANSNFEIEIVSTTGKVIHKMNTIMDSQMDISSLVSGIYFVRGVADNRFAIHRFVKCE